MEWVNAIYWLQLCVSLYNILVKEFERVYSTVVVVLSVYYLNWAMSHAQLHARSSIGKPEVWAYPEHLRLISTLEVKKCKHVQPHVGMRESGIVACMNCAGCCSTDNVVGKKGKLTMPLREITYHMGSRSVTCHPAGVTFLPLPQLKSVLGLATPKGCKAELT